MSEYPPRSRAPLRSNREATGLRGIKGYLLPVFLLSGVINVLYLSGSWFMLEVYDRVVPGRSIPTLVGLITIVLTLYSFQAVLDVLRSRVLVRLGTSMAAELGPIVFTRAQSLKLYPEKANNGPRLLQDLEQLRKFISGPGFSTLFDLPWIPIYLVLCFAFHPWIGWTAVAGIAILISITIVLDIVSSGTNKASNICASARDNIANASLRNAEVAVAMSMQGALARRWVEADLKHLASQQASSDLVGTSSSLSKVLRMALQSIVLAVGALLVISGQSTAGVMIASSILTSRALAPVDSAIGHWRGLVAARQSWGRLRLELRAGEPGSKQMDLPPPVNTLGVKMLSGAPLGQARPVIEGINFTLHAGDGLAILGHSASGKSSLARTLVGIWSAVEGSVSLDGAALHQWAPQARGSHIGYLPQDVELFQGTLAQNIARFAADPCSDDIIAAAQAANVHEMIVGMTDGYDTQIGEQGSLLSAGQRQRVGLARALYGNPFLVVLDEPNSNLDAVGENALAAAVMGVRERGGIVIVVAHRPAILAPLDHVLVMSQGRMHAFGPKTEVLGLMLRRPAGQPDVASAIAPERGARGLNFAASS